MGRVGVVEGVRVQNVVACVALVGEVAGAAEVEQNGLPAAGEGGVVVDAAEEGCAHRGLEGGGAVDDDGVGGGEGGEFVVFVECAVDNGGFAEAGKGGIKRGGAQIGGDGNVGIFPAKDGEKGSYRVIRRLSTRVVLGEEYAYLLPGLKRPRIVPKPFDITWKIFFSMNTIA